MKQLVVVSAILVFGIGYAPAAQQKPASKSAKHSHRNTKKRKTSWKKKGQQGITPQRAAEIQQALIRENYLTGEPSGNWDTTTQAAMIKYQADHGWQTKEIPDSRAIIKLGLGPHYSAESLVNAPVRSSSGGVANVAATRGATASSEKQ
jgi:peptidoglycan hydrolase-like protein with peptidoglycan-binding domain